MLPVLFHVWIPAALAKPLLVLGVLLLTVGRAGIQVWWSRRAGKRLGLGAALRDDALVVVVVLAAGVAIWRAGYVDRELSIPLHAYGLLLAAAFLGGVWLAQREARRRGQDAGRIGDLAFWLLLAGWLGSDVYFKLVNWRDFFLPGTFLVESPLLAGAANALTLGLFAIERVPRFLLPAGLVFYGGFIAAALTAAVYLRRHRMPFLAYADTLVPSVAFGHFLGRLGCFCAGCCWGSVSRAHLPWLVSFPPESLAYQSFAARPDAAAYLDVLHRTTLPLHPTQLYEAFGELALFAALVLWVRPRKRFDGQVLAAWLLAYAVLRTVVELFRGDVERGVVAGLGVGQWTSLAIFAAGAIVWVRARRAAAVATSAAPA